MSKKSKFSKNHLFSCKNSLFLNNIFFLGGGNIPLSFSILGICNLTRVLQSREKNAIQRLGVTDEWTDKRNPFVLHWIQWANWRVYILNQYNSGKHENKRKNRKKNWNLAFLLLPFWALGTDLLNYVLLFNRSE